MHLWCHRMVSKYVTKRKETEIQGEDVEIAVERIMKNEKKLRYAAALFELNPSAAFCGMPKGRKKLGNVDYKLMYSYKYIF